MPSESTPVSTVTASGNNGVRIYSQTHEDIDTSEIDITCLAGAVEVQLDERIWWSWRRRNSWQLQVNGTINTSVDVDSSYYDGDHRLTVYARANGTRCQIAFNSYDW